MPAKTPIYLKTPTPRRGKKLRLRDVLSGDMISPPLGDFRHSAHIGPDGEGDMFGELGFLQGRRDLLVGIGSGRGGSPGAGRAFHCLAGGGCRTLLKSAVSLPTFGGAAGPDQAPPKPPRLHLDEAPGEGRQQQRSMSVSGAPGPPFSARATRDPLPSSASFSTAVPGGCSAKTGGGRWESGHPCGTPPPRSESLLRLDLDLGPSILDDVLRIMDGYPRGAAAPEAL